MEKYLDQTLTPEERAKNLLDELSIKEKMGQVGCYFMTVTETGKNLSTDYPVGVGQVSALEMRMLYNLDDAVAKQKMLQKKVMTLSPHHIPAIFHMEGLCGAYLQGATSFQTGIGRGATWNPELEKKVAEVVGRQERAVGVTQTFAPVLDISRDSRMGRQGEAYGEDPTLNSALGVAFVEGLQEQDSKRKTDAVAKHFVASQATLGGIHGAENDLSDRMVEEIFAKPFQAAISKGHIKGIMPCYASVNGQPVSVSHRYLTDLLRHKMGFDGLTVSDYAALKNAHDVQKIGESYTDTGYMGMAAGMDMELHFTQCFNAELGEWFADGKCNEQILDEAVLRVLTAKFRMGLFEQPFALDGQELEAQFNHQDDNDIAKQEAEESIVLLKNDGALPIKKNVQKIAVIGCHANTGRTMFGGYTHFSMLEGSLAAVSTMAGLQTTKGDMPEVHTIPGTNIEKDKPQFEEAFHKSQPQSKSLLEALTSGMPDKDIQYAYGYDIAGNDHSHFEAALEAAKDADLVITTLGGKYGTGSIATTGEGIDSSDINLPECQDAFINEVTQLNIPVVGIHFDGRPISSDVADEKLNAILEAWTPAQGGAEALTDILRGEYNPGGKLPVSVARSAGQIPVHYNHLNGSSYHQGESVGFSDYVNMSHQPRYFFGEGLSYTTFAFSDMNLDKKTVAPNGVVDISVKVTNTGKVAGEVVPQLYVKDVYARMSRPVFELAGFKRLYLKQGEQKTVHFKLNANQLAFLDEDMNWLVEAGKIQVMIGDSSKNLILKDDFEIAKSQRIDGKQREFYAEVHVEE